MRKYINLNKTSQNDLSNQFPDLMKLVCVEETTHYSYLAVSVFDHWLSREDSCKLLENVPKNEQEKRNAALYSFSKKIASETSVVNFKVSGKWTRAHPRFRDFTSNRAKLEYLRPAIEKSHHDFFKVVLPELGVVFFESWDDTNAMYLKDASVKEKIVQWAAECGVYCLDKWA